MKVSNVIERGVVRLFKILIPILFLGLSLAYIGILTVGGWFLCLALIDFIFRNILSMPGGLIGVLLGSVIFVGACVWSLTLTPALQHAIGEGVSDLINLGTAIGNRIADIPSSDANHPLSLEYELARRGGKILIEFVPARLDATERESAAHCQLRRALAQNDLAAFTSLLAHVRDIDAKRDELQSPQQILLHEAAALGRTEFVALLLARGANVNSVDLYRGGLTALGEAAKNGHLPAVELLLGHGADVNPKVKGMTPLWYAAICHGGHPDVVQVLLKHGADVNARDSDGRTVLSWATLDEPQGRKRLVVALLKLYGAQK